MTDYTWAATPFKVISLCTYGLLLALLALGGRPVLTAWTCVFCDITVLLTRHFKLLYAESLPEVMMGYDPEIKQCKSLVFFFFLFSKCIICNFSRQRKKIWHCVSTHGALTAGLRPDQHIFALLARFGSLGLHPLPWNRSQLEGALFYLRGAEQRHMCKWLKQNFHQAI